MLGLGGSIPPQAEPEQGEDEGGDDGGANEGGGGGGVHLAGLQRQGGYGHDERQLPGGEDAERRPVAEREQPAVEQQRWHSAHDEEQRDEQRQLQQRDRIGEQLVGVEGHPAGDEEERDQEAVADGRQLRLEDRELASAKRQTRDHPGDEAPQQQIQAKLARESDQREHQDHREPHTELAGRLEGSLDQRPAPPRGAHSEDAGHDRQRYEEHEDQGLVQRLARRQHQRHQHDGPELRRRPRREQVRAESGAKLAGIPEDRDQRANGGRRHGRPRVEVG